MWQAQTLGTALKRDAPPLQGVERLATTKTAVAAVEEGDAGGSGRAQGRASSLHSMIGQQVRLVGLQARPELNGVVGMCERFDGKQQRYAVRVEGRGQPLAIKGTNLELIEGGGKDEL